MSTKTSKTLDISTVSSVVSEDMCIRRIDGELHAIACFKVHEDLLIQKPTEKQLKAGATWELEKVIEGLFKQKKNIKLNGEVEEFEVTFTISRFAGAGSTEVDQDP